MCSDNLALFYTLTLNCFGHVTWNPWFEWKAALGFATSSESFIRPKSLTDSLMKIFKFYCTVSINHKVLIKVQIRLNLNDCKTNEHVGSIEKIIY